MNEPASPSGKKSNPPSSRASKTDPGENRPIFPPPDPSLLPDLLAAFYASSFKNSLDQVISLCPHLTGADIAAFYQLVPDPNLSRSRSEYDLIVADGHSPWLPTSLPTSEIGTLLSSSGSRLPATSHLWTASQRPVVNLHQIFLRQKFSYLFVKALNEDNLPGKTRLPTYLLLLAGQENPPPGDILQRSQSVGSLLQTLKFCFSLQGELATKSRDLEKVEVVEKLLQEHIHEGVLLADSTLHIFRINHAAENILGFYNHEVSGHLLQNVLVGSENLWSTIEEIVLNHKPLEINEIRLFRRSGDAFLANLHVQPVIVDAELNLIVILLHDLTEEEIIRERNRHLEQRAILGEVTAVFAHEVRNPINNISTGLELISYNLAPGDPNQEIISRLIQDCDRLGELMRSVLSFARPMEFTMTSIPVEPYLIRIMERAKSKLERNSIIGSVQVESGCPNLLGSPQALEQVIVNLMNNAVQAMSDTGGQLILRARPIRQETEPANSINPNQRPTKSLIEISVVDTGPGIPKDFQDRIFQPFFTTNSGGTGLGLAICKRIVTAHRGNIQVESFPGGTVFRILIPVALFE